MHYRARKAPVTTMIGVAANVDGIVSHVDYRDALLKALRPLVRKGNETQWRALRVGLCNNNVSHIKELVFDNSDNQLALAKFCYSMLGCVITPSEEAAFIKGINNGQAE